MPISLDAAGLRRWAERAVAVLAARRDDINALNVFPVADADTGSNMAFTMQSAVDSADAVLADAPATDLAHALARGAVRGARGNSGMVLSQVLRGTADTVTDEGLTGPALSNALNTSVDYVLDALAGPVEGTIVTVLRAAAAGAEAAAAASAIAETASTETANAGTADATANAPDLPAVLRAAIESATAALEKTTAQLPALQEAGVVDAGGAGLVLVLAAMLDVADSKGTYDARPLDRLLERGSQRHDDARAAGAGRLPSHSAGAHGKDAHGTGCSRAADAEIEAVFYFGGDLEALAEELRELGTSLVIARTDDTHANVHIHSHDAGRVIETAYARGEVSGIHLEALPQSAPTPASGERPALRRTVFAAAPDGPVAELFASAGARVINPGDTVEDAGDEDIVMRNGTRTRTTAGHLIDAGSLVAGIAAMSVYDDNALDTRAAVAAMEEAAAAMRVDRPREDSLGAIMSTCRDLLFGGGEQITILSPLDVNADALSAQLGVDVMALRVPGMRTEIGVE